MINVEEKAEGGIQYARAERDHLEDVAFIKQFLSWRRIATDLESSWRNPFSAMGFPRKLSRMNSEISIFMQKALDMKDDPDGPFPSRWEDDESSVNGKRPIEIFSEKYHLWWPFLTTTLVAIKGDEALVAGGGAFSVILASKNEEFVVNYKGLDVKDQDTIIVDKVDLLKEQVILLVPQGLHNNATFAPYAPSKKFSGSRLSLVTTKTLLDSELTCWISSRKSSGSTAQAREQRRVALQRVGCLGLAMDARNLEGLALRAMATSSFMTESSVEFLPP
ncbi:uncharacterized protein LOC112347563 [Selaginella moellendorffii]|uniref:uncharacterized protein LOC112347563 n=1 Tax=Selaginella moellendorffii TaxID=88036 RepID=UPI000D1C382A|nr:uncharacterized protein LOC112347563 [Selaginella moellendorffii]|eukprot:XP_024534430.1 uncharacterized protein LOC112347563 [Selaginella moellendorffii]